MRVCLVKPMHTPLGAPIRMPLGLLSLATVLENENLGIELQFLDLDLIAAEEEIPFGKDFLQGCVDLIIHQEPDLIGFTTMCHTYPHVIRMSKICRELSPGSLIVFGGPQATIVDRDTLDAFPFIDFIVRGEAERSFPRLLWTLSKEGDLSQVKGLTYRYQGKIHRNEDAELVADLDELPIPAYHLYLHAQNHIDRLDVDVGRGCPFNCTFCSTSQYWRRKCRFKSTPRIIQEIKYLLGLFGAKPFTFTHDLFTLNRNKVMELCNALINENLNISWICTSRIDCADYSQLQMMAKAGCQGVYYGVESGSSKIQKSIRKNIPLEKVPLITQATVEAGISVTLSFMAGFPDETLADLQDTLQLIFECLRRLHNKARFQLHLLTLYPGTLLFEKYKGKLLFDGYSAMAPAEFITDAENVRLLRQHPELFSSFYYIDVPHLKRDMLRSLVNFVCLLIPAFPLTLLAIADDLGNPLELHNKWLEWLEHNGLEDLKYLNPQRLSPEVERVFRKIILTNFQQFVIEAREKGMFTTPYLPDLLAFEAACDRCCDVDYLECYDETEDAFPKFESSDWLFWCPKKRNDVQTLSLGFDLREIISVIVAHQTLSSLTPKPYEIICFQKEPGMVQVARINAFASRLLRACDGKRTVHEILSTLRIHYSKPDNVILLAMRNHLQAFYQMGLVL